MIVSCGFIVVRREPNLSFLLMKHHDRWDIPKGHVDDGETEIQCALRELREETAITEKQLSIDGQFRFSFEYQVRLTKNGGELKPKRLVVFLATLTEPAEIVLTEHIGYEWFDWNPPHKIQLKTINPLMEAVEQHWRKNGIADF